MDARITLISSVARLLDLHQTSHGRGVAATIIAAPRPPASSAGFFLSLGLAIIDTLRSLELERGPGYQSKSKVTESALVKISGATEADVDYCVRFLSQGREILSLVGHGDGEEKTTRMADTALIEKAGEFSQIRLTETARLLFRIDAASESWLYKDKDVEKITVAIERGHFHDVGRFCKETIISLGELGLRLTQLEERPTLTQKKQEFTELHTHYSETISRAQHAISKAISLTSSEIVRERFVRWTEHYKAEYDISFILNDLEHVSRVIESVNRKLMRFIQKAQGSAASSIGIIKFQEIAYRIAMAPLEYATAFAQVGILMPAPVRQSLFHPFDLVGLVELDTAQPEEEHKEPFFMGDKPDHAAHQHLNSFIDRNFPAIIGMLRKGPVSFATLIEELGFMLELGETFADFAGIYSFMDDNDTYLIRVGLDGGRFEMRTENLLIHGDNVILSLSGEIHETA